MKKQVRVVWTGRVQGVGFRYTAEISARALKLVGWVRNLSDGRVEAVCEGPENRLKAFLDDVRTGPMQRYIQRVHAEWRDPTGEFDDFGIRFY